MIMTSLNQLLWELRELEKATGFNYIEGWIKYKATLDDNGEEITGTTVNA